MFGKRKTKVFERYWNRNNVTFYPDFPGSVEVIVVVPVLDDREIFRTIDSLCDCTHVEGKVGVIIVVNHGEQAEKCVKEANVRLAEELCGYVAAKEHGEIFFRVMKAFDLPAKTAGVGLARKLAMDAAAWWMYVSGKEECPIASLDADTLVAANYTDAICRYFRKNDVAGISIAYEHRLEECGDRLLAAMVKYELYLRYYQLALSYVGHPYAYHCIGSAFAVRGMDYVAVGGMNKRQAGEDFYFLQKLISTGRYGLLKETKVYPSARCSERTPFGTGRSVKQIMEDGMYRVYHWAAFCDLKFFFQDLKELYKAEEKDVDAYMERQARGIREYWSAINGKDLIMEVNTNSASSDQFLKRFFDTFNAFQVLKYLNAVHGPYYSKIEISEAVDLLLVALNRPLLSTDTNRLAFLRNL